MSDSSKYIFDKVFVPGEPHPDDVAASMIEPGDVPAYSQNQVDEMLAAARNEGVTEAIASAKHDTSAYTAQTLEYITQEMTRLGTFQDSVVRAIHKEAVELARIIALKLARGLMTREPMTEVSALISDMLRQFSVIGAAPRLVVYVNALLLDSISAEIAKLTAVNAFSGEIIVLEGEGFGPTDCAIEWAEGGAIRDVEMLEQEITQTVDRYLAAIEAGAGQDIGMVELADDDPAIESLAEQPAPLEALSPQPEEPQPEELEPEVPELEEAQLDELQSAAPSVIESIVAEAQADAALLDVGEDVGEDVGDGPADLAPTPEEATPEEIGPGEVIAENVIHDSA